LLAVTESVKGAPVQRFWLMGWLVMLGATAVTVKLVVTIAAAA
jgi:hypothetical protein